MKVTELVSYLDEYLGVEGHPDARNALNGLQLEGHDEVRSIAAAVDASLATIEEAIQRGVDMLIVHHGLFWGGLQPLTGRRYAKVQKAIDARLAVYSAHLPLDAHPDVGNGAVLARAVGLDIDAPFGEYQGVSVGWQGRMDEPREFLLEKLENTVGGPVRLIPGGPERVRRAAVATGAGGSLIGEAHAAGIDTLITGEGAHHTYFDAMELGVNVFYAGHYATETWGVRALAMHLEGEFGLHWEFIDLPTGM